MKSNKILKYVNKNQLLIYCLMSLSVFFFSTLREQCYDDNDDVAR